MPAGCCKGLDSFPRGIHLQDVNAAEAPFYRPVLPAGRWIPFGRGSCSCGSVRFRTRMPKNLDMHHCHCTTCQLWTGADLQSWVMLDTKDLVWEGGDTMEVVHTSSTGRRGRCTICSTAIFMQYTTKDEEGTVYVAAGIFDDSSFTGYIKSCTHPDHLYTESAPPWNRRPASFIPVCRCNRCKEWE